MKTFPRYNVQLFELDKFYQNLLFLYCLLELLVTNIIIAGIIDNQIRY